MIYVLVIRYFAFWYTKGFVRLLKYFRAYIVMLADTFSVKSSILTWFAPWRRDVVSLEGLPLDQKFQVVIMNIVSRFFGAFIKTITLAIFLVVLIVLLVLELIGIIAWLGLPIFVVCGVVFGLLIFLTPNGV